MKSPFLRALFACLLCTAVLFSLFACDGGGDPTTEPPVEDKTPDAATLYLSQRDRLKEANGRFSVSSSSLLQMSESAVRVELYAATDGEEVYQETDLSTDGKAERFSHAYTDGALRADGTVTPMTAAEYRALYGFPSYPVLDASLLVPLTVHRELGGYCFTVAIPASQAGEFMRGVLGRELHALYTQASVSTVYYVFHFRQDGALDRLDLRAQLTLKGQEVSLSAGVRYAEIGTARPVPPSA